MGCRGLHSSLVLLIGAEVLPWKIRVKGGALRHRLATRPVESAVYCDLARQEDARHGAHSRPGLCRRGHRRSVAAGTADLRERASRPGGGAPVRASAREGATWPPPRSRTVAHRCPALVLAVMPVSITHSLDDFASLACVRASGPAFGVPEARP
jgi:hypothetical protein